MTDEELKALEKEVKTLKRIASERAGALHDLVEDRLPAAYRDLPAIAQTAFDACEAWAIASERLRAHTASIASANS